ncbi:hypothetical protein [Kineosporia sp. A_224]|uniref:hypothetical protein n=1 Tax=Kineosporia sp. A_224 TaxID=1962180 RepID=UPI00117B866A|nr:hypothetical protein [Kineosporia sp. A_224]
MSRPQLLGLGLTSGQVDALLDSRRWQGLHPGVYATFTGPVPALTRAWAAVLAAGDGAALGGTTALWLWGVHDGPPAVMTVCVPGARHVVQPRGVGRVRVVRRRRLDGRVHPARQPPRLRLEEAVLDLADEATQEAAVVDLVIRATASRRTSPERLRSALDARAHHRHRRLLVEVLGETAEGVQSALERRYRRGVERPHGLPRGHCNRPEPVHDGRGRKVRNRYRDVRYRRWGLVVELDGLEAHPRWLAWLDRGRDNSVTVVGDRSLQYGWHETVDDPCGMAVEVITVLRHRGWRGTPTPCGPACPVAPLVPSTDPLP